MPTVAQALCSAFEGRVYAESNQGPHAHKLQSWADVATATGHPDPLGLDPRILYDTSLESRVEDPGRIPQRSQARIGPQPRVVARGV